MLALKRQEEEEELLQERFQHFQRKLHFCKFWHFSNESCHFLEILLKTLKKIEEDEEKKDSEESSEYETEYESEEDEGPRLKPVYVRPKGPGSKT